MQNFKRNQTEMEPEENYEKIRNESNDLLLCLREGITPDQLATTRPIPSHPIGSDTKQT